MLRRAAFEVLMMMSSQILFTILSFEHIPIAMEMKKQFRSGVFPHRYRDWLHKTCDSYYDTRPRPQATVLSRRKFESESNIRHPRLLNKNIYAKGNVSGEGTHHMYLEPCKTIGTLFFFLFSWYVQPAFLVELGP